jgi:Zn-dependent peptidase ImmA (M78 family)
MSLGASLRSARTKAKLSAEDLAALASITVEQLERFERGELSLTAREVDRCASALGFRLHDLETWTGKEPPLSVLLRDSLGSDFDLADGIALEVHAGLGEFQRTVRDIAELESLLGIKGDRVPQIPRSTESSGGARGEELADRVRKHLELDLEPIPSMRKLIEETLGIAVIWVSAEHLDPSVDGASTNWSRPAIMANLLEANRYPWRARTTLAHELCHVLFDYAQRGTLFSPARRIWPLGGQARGPALPAPLLEIETVARAFSACFLAPTAGVRRAVGKMDPLSEQAIHRVGETYGVGRQVAINRLSKVFHLSREHRSTMESRSPEPYFADFSGDEVAMVDGFRGDPLRSLVRRALVAGKIRPARARQALALGANDPLPFPELGELAAPAIPRSETIRRIAQAVLRERYPDEDLEALRVLEEDGAFRVVIYDGGVGSTEQRRRGHVEITASGEVSDIHLQLPGAAE